MLPEQSPVVAPPPPKPQSSRWDNLTKRANSAGSIVVLILLLLGGGGIVGYVIANNHKAPAPVKTPAIETLSQSDLNKLGSVGSNLGTTNQVLDVGADALFRGKADVVGDLSVGGALNANGTVTLSQLNISGATAASNINVGDNLNVSGTTTLQKTLTANGTVNINSNLSVSGAASFGSLSASSLTVKSISIVGPLTIEHLSTSGPTPFYASGSVGAGGTVNISGNDTAGKLNINTGTGPAANTILANITFRAAYSGDVHVLLSPLTSAAAAAQVYVTHNNAGFQVYALNTTGLSGKVMSFDYFVTQ
jgi:hypothetical protein